MGILPMRNNPARHGQDAHATVCFLHGKFNPVVSDQWSLVKVSGSKICRAFSLLEMLVVIAIMGILIALAVPAIGPLMRSSNMNKATSMIIDELNFARQTSLTLNRDVEVRFYQLPSKSDPNDKQYRAFRSFAATGNNSTNSPLTTVKYLPEPVIVSTGKDKAGNTVSTLLDYSNPGLSGLTQSTEVLPGGAGPTTYISFLFRATGGTSLAPVSANWFATIYLENAPKNAATGIPDNYFTAQVDPVTGRARTYRP